MAVSLLATVAAMGLVSAQGAPGHATAPAPAKRFAPPTDEFVISRAVIRLLSDGKQIVVTRSYRVRFVPENDGYRLDGTLIGVEVNVPPILSSLAEIERKRPDTGLFPIMLSRDGAIRDQDTQAIDRDARRKALEAGNLILTQRGIDPERSGESSKLLNQLTFNLPNSPWPSDMFFAQPGERRISRQISLSDGREGTVEVLLRIAAPLPCGLPQSVERIVTTHLGGTSMVSREVFTIAFPAP